MFSLHRPGGSQHLGIGRFLSRPNNERSAVKTFLISRRVTRNRWKQTTTKLSLSLSCLHIFSAVTERKGGGTCAIEYRDQPDSDQPKNPHKLRKINTTGAFGFRGDDPGSRLPRLYKRRRRPLLLPLSSYQRRR